MSVITYKKMDPGGRARPVSQKLNGMPQGGGAAPVTKFTIARGPRGKDLIRLPHPEPLGHR